MRAEQRFRLRPRSVEIAASAAHEGCPWRPTGRCKVRGTRGTENKTTIASSLNPRLIQCCTRCGRPNACACFTRGEELVLHRQTDQPAAQRLAWRCRHIPLPPAGRPIVVAGCEAIHTYAVICVT